MSASKPPVPNEIKNVIAKELRTAHLDENQGVAIGVRNLAFAILDLYEEDPKIWNELQLGQPWNDPTEWAAIFCINPIRRHRGPYVPPPRSD